MLSRSRQWMLWGSVANTPGIVSKQAWRNRGRETVNGLVFRRPLRLLRLFESILGDLTHFFHFGLETLNAVFERLDLLLQLQLLVCHSSSSFGCSVLCGP